MRGEVLAGPGDRVGPGHCQLREVDRLFDLLLPGSDRCQEDRTLDYDAAHLVARLLLDRGRQPVLECTYSRAHQRAGLLGVLAGVAAPLHVVELSVGADEAVRRFRGRDQQTDLDDRAVRERARSFPRSPGALQLSSSGAPPPELAEQVIAWLSTGPAPVDPGTWVRAGLL